MWVKSKDQKKLLNINYIEICGKKIYGYQHAIFIGDYSSGSNWGSNNDVLLGEYESETRCIDILDEIESAIINKRNIYYMPEK